MLAAFHRHMTMVRRLDRIQSLPYPDLQEQTRIPPIHRETDFVEMRHCAGMLVDTP